MEESPCGPLAAQIHTVDRCLDTKVTNVLIQVEASHSLTALRAQYLHVRADIIVLLDVRFGDELQAARARDRLEDAVERVALRIVALVANSAP
jgi:hypothetical protein